MMTSLWRHLYTKYCDVAVEVIP